MGLVFALQPDLRASKPPHHLVLASSKRRFALGSGFLFGAALLGTMFLAASPLFKVLWEEGGLFDKFLTLFFYLPIFLYPLVALGCWFYSSHVEIDRESDGRFVIRTRQQVGPLSWGKKEFRGRSLQDLSVENWKGAVNVAALQSKPDRYATRGHWLLRLRGKNSPTEAPVLERRAKLEDIQWLVAQIEAYFSPPKSPGSPAG